MELNKPDSQLTDIVEQDSPNKKCSMDSAGSSSIIKSNVPAAAAATRGLRVHSTPRIDISRASSSSQHEDSRDSSPENVFDQVGTGTLQEAATTTSDLGFVEDGATDLRSSTEELFFADTGDKSTRSKTETDAQQVSSSFDCRSFSSIFVKSMLLRISSFRNRCGHLLFYSDSMNSSRRACNKINAKIRPVPKWPRCYAFPVERVAFRV